MMQFPKCFAVFRCNGDNRGLDYHQRLILCGTKICYLIQCLHRPAFKGFIRPRKLVRVPQDLIGQLDEPDPRAAVVIKAAGRASGNGPFQVCMPGDQEMNLRTCQLVDLLECLILVRCFKRLVLFQIFSERRPQIFRLVFLFAEECGNIINGTEELFLFRGLRHGFSFDSF